MRVRIRDQRRLGKPRRCGIGFRGLLFLSLLSASAGGAAQASEGLPEKSGAVDIARLIAEIGLGLGTDTVYFEPCGALGLLSFTHELFLDTPPIEVSVAVDLPEEMSDIEAPEQPNQDELPSVELEQPDLPSVETPKASVSPNFKPAISCSGCSGTAEPVAASIFTQSGDSEKSVGQPPFWSRSRRLIGKASPALRTQLPPGLEKKITKIKKLKKAKKARKLETDTASFSISTAESATDLSVTEVESTPEPAEESYWPLLTSKTVREVIVADVLSAHNGPEVLTTSSDGLSIWSGSGKLLSSAYLPGTLSLGDLDGDGRLEVVGPGLKRLYIFDDGQLTEYFTSDDHSVPIVVTDLDGDGTEELVSFDHWNATLTVLDENGRVKDFGNSVWPVELMPAVGNTHRSCMAVGDIDGDGKKEIAVQVKKGGLNNDGPILYVQNYDGTRKWTHVIPNYEHWVEGPDSYFNDVAMGDVDADGLNEVVHVHGNYHAYTGWTDSLIYVLDGTGAIEQEWVLDGAALDMGFHGDVQSMITLSDLDQDAAEDLEIILTGRNLSGVGIKGRVAAWHHDGTPVEGFPVTMDQDSTTPVLAADITGDGFSNLISQPWAGSLDPASPAVFAWDHQGVLLSEWPKTLTRQGTYGGCVPYLKGTLWDKDNDGLLDLLMPICDGEVHTLPLAASFNPATLDWPVFRQNLRRTACQGCGDALVQTLPPDVAFKSDVTSGDAPLAVQFTDLSTGSMDAWSWDFGDGALSSEQHPSHTYTTEGTYAVKLTVSGPGGSSTLVKENLIRIGKKEKPKPSEKLHVFFTKRASGPLTILLTDHTKADIVKRHWKLGDGTTSTAESPEHTYEAKGKYLVELSVTLSDGRVGQATKYVTVSPKVEKNKK